VPSIDWEDNQRRVPPHKSVAATASNAVIPASPNTLDVTNITTVTHRAVRISVNPGARAIQVTCYWDIDGSAGGYTVPDTKTYQPNAPSSQLFEVKGHFLQQVSFTSIGGASTIAYDIVEADPSPLATSSGSGEFPTLYQPFPVHTITNGGDDNHWHSVLVDTATAGGLINRSTPGAVAGNYITFRCRLGPYGSLWCFDQIFETAPDYGIVSLYLASAGEDGSFTGTMTDMADVTFIKHAGADVDTYAAALTRNLIIEGNGSVRVMGQPGAPLTAMTVDAETGAMALNGGPGIYYVRPQVDAKIAASGGFKAGLAFMAAKRIAFDFA
jgi:hypothetical protein